MEKKYIFLLSCIISLTGRAETSAESAGELILKSLLEARCNPERMEIIGADGKQMSGMQFLDLPGQEINARIEEMIPDIVSNESQNIYCNDAPFVFKSTKMDPNSQGWWGRNWKKVAAGTGLVGGALLAGYAANKAGYLDKAKDWLGLGGSPKIDTDTQKEDFWNKIQDAKNRGEAELQAKKNETALVPVSEAQGMSRADNRAMRIQERKDEVAKQQSEIQALKDQTGLVPYQGTTSLEEAKAHEKAEMLVNEQAKRENAIRQDNLRRAAEENAQRARQVESSLKNNLTAQLEELNKKMDEANMAATSHLSLRPDQVHNAIKATKKFQDQRDLLLQQNANMFNEAERATLGRNPKRALEPLASGIGSLANKGYETATAGLKKVGSWLGW